MAGFRKRVNTRKEHQVFFTCRREIKLLKKEMEDCEYTGKIVLIEPYICPDGTSKIRVVVEVGDSKYRWASWTRMIARVRSNTTQRKYTTKQVLEALKDSGVSTNKTNQIINRLYPNYNEDLEDMHDWVNEPWYKEV